MMDGAVSVLATAGYVALCVLLFSASIAIHEFGHFIVALKLGYRVDRFSIGFGRAIWKKTVRGVEYRISWIPFGGYVSIPDVDPEGTKKLEGSADGEAKAKRPFTPFRDLLVAVAGPAMNIVFALALATALHFAPGARFGSLPATVGDLVVDGPADAAGMMIGDTVKSVGGHPVASWHDLTTEVQFAAGGDTEIEVIRGGETVTLRVAPQTYDNGVAYIGALSVPDDRAGSAMWMPSRGILDQLAWDAGAVFRALKGLVTPREMKATGRALGGPVMIACATYRSIRRDTWDGLGFLRFVNTNLAVMNLLPIPVLDGGLILFSLLAIVFRRRLPEKLTDALTNVFMYVLVALMVFLVGRDFWRIGTARPAEMTGRLRSEVAAEGAGQGAESPDAPPETEGGAQ